ncbi:MAG: NERD domain-containing protein, partial [Clostridia bacterium]|nr:NERD domain-containing protein [Clostridia bacterium]
ALKELLKGYKNLKFHSIIAFIRRCELREIKIESNVTVIYDTEISNVILKRNKEVVLNNSDVLNIYNAINEANITDKNLRAEHIKQIKRKA